MDIVNCGFQTESPLMVDLSHQITIEDLTNAFVDCHQFAEYWFNQDKIAEKTGCIFRAMLAARLLLLSQIAHRLPGNSDANFQFPAATSHYR